MSRPKKKTGKKPGTRKKKSRNRETLDVRLPKELDIDTAMQIAVRAHQADDYDTARTIYTRVLEIAPEHPGALNFLGILEHQNGDAELGLSMLEKAVEVAPDYIDAINNLGTIYRSLDRPEEAQQCYQRCLELDDEFASAYWNLGEMLRHTHRYEDAVDYYRRAILKWPNKTEIMHLLAACLRYSKQPAEAAEIYREILNIRPGDATAIHMLAASTGLDVPPRSSDAYVTHLFDGFSADFDQCLERLGYRAPSLVVAALDEAHPNPDGRLRILDVGCGTGLCGPGLRPYAKTLEGVDISTGMLDKARERDCYDKLHQSELTAWLSGHASSYDVIVSADVLCYFGDLGEAFGAAHDAVVPGGCFIFTVEASREDDTDDWRIYAHGRYSHRDSYLRRALETAGFLTERLDGEKLRMESGEPVAGWVVVARRPA